MRFLVADTFARSVARLDDKARRSVQCAAFGFQMNPSHPGLRLHRLVHARDPGFWSLSVNRDLRIIVHRAQSEVVFCYADHHDKAYAWAERRKLGMHPESGALSFVEIAEPSREAAAAPAPDHDHERPSQEARRPGDGVPAGTPAPVLDLQRRLRIRARAAAPLPDHPTTSGSDSGDRPLAQLLQLAHRLGCGAAAIAEDRMPSAEPSPASPQLPEPPIHAKAEMARGAALHVKVLALALLAAPWPLLASFLVWRGAGDGVAVALAPGGVGSLLLVSAGLLAAWSVRVATRRAAREAERIREQVRSGNFDVRFDPAGIDPALRPLLRASQEAVEAFSAPFEEATGALARIARGEIPAPLARSSGGEFDRQRDAINAIVGFVQLRPEDIRAIIGSVSVERREAGRESCTAREGS